MLRVLSLCWGAGGDGRCRVDGGRHQKQVIPMSLHAMDWNEIAHSYSQVENSRKEVVFPFVRDKLKKLRPARLLDFGCGDGTFAMMCRDLAREIFNYDIAPEMNLLARETCASASNIALLAALDEADTESMDAITMNAVWMCLPTAEACALALRQMHALLRPAGRLLASFTHPCFRDRRFCGLEAEFDQRKYLMNGTGFKVRIFDGKGSVEISDTHWNFSAVTEQLVTAGFMARRIYELPDAGKNAAEALGSPWVVLEAVKMGQK